MGPSSQYACVMCNGVINAPAKDVLSLFEDNTRIGEYNSFCKDIRYVFHGYWRKIVKMIQIILLHFTHFIFITLMRFPLLAPSAWRSWYSHLPVCDVSQAGYTSLRRTNYISFILLSFYIFDISYFSYIFNVFYHSYTLHFCFLLFYFRDVEYVSQDTKITWIGSPPIFPFKPRDFCTIVHIRKLKDGTIVVLNR